MLSPLAYYSVLLIVCGYAFLRGRRDERAAAATCIVATIATHIMTSPVVTSFSRVETGVFLVDVLALIAFTAVALRSDRFWPLWLAGFQLTTLLSHLLKALQLDLMPQAYAAAARFW